MKENTILPTATSINRQYVQKDRSLFISRDKRQRQIIDIEIINEKSIKI